MKMLQHLTLASVTLAVSLSASSVASAADELCSIIKSCDQGCYTSYSRTVDVQTNASVLLNACDSELDVSESEYVTFLAPLNWAPVPPVVECAGSSSGHVYCEGWPKGDSITYGWSATGTFHSDGGTPGNAIRGFSCTHGTNGIVTVTAYSPQGAASSVSTAVTCP